MSEKRRVQYIFYILKYLYLNQCWLFFLHAPQKIIIYKKQLNDQTKDILKEVENDWPKLNFR